MEQPEPLANGLAIMVALLLVAESDLLSIEYCAKIYQESKMANKAS
jgi:hypothetical protein